VSPAAANTGDYNGTGMNTTADLDRAGEAQVELMDSSDHLQPCTNGASRVILPKTEFMA
jgi:hypothetical protein